MFSKLRISFFLMVCSIGLSAQDYIVYEKNGEPTDLMSLAKQASMVDVVFFGEVHDDSLAHIVELELLDKLIDVKNKKVVLSLEMFETDVQNVLDEYLHDYIGEEIFIKDARAWTNYKSDYRPLVEKMKSLELEVVAANAPRRYVRALSKSGMSALTKLPKSSKIYFADLPFHILQGRYKEKFQEIMEGHTIGFDNIYLSQNLWDATMAKSIYLAKKNSKKSTILHISGKFHCEESLGTVAQLKKLDSRLTNMIIVNISKEDFDVLSGDQRTQLADYFIVTSN